jgi:hypothetical protein
MDKGVRELVISYLSPRFFTLLVLAGDARTGGAGLATRRTRRARYANFWCRTSRCFANIQCGHIRRRYLACTRAPATARDCERVWALRGGQAEPAYAGPGGLDMSGGLFHVGLFACYDRMVGRASLADYPSVDGR